MMPVKSAPSMRANRADARVLDAEAAGAVERAMARHVGLGLGAAEGAEREQLAVDRLVRRAGLGVEQHDPGHQLEHAARHAHELIDGAFGRAGLVQQLTRGQQRELVGGQQPGARVGGAEALRLAVGEVEGEAIDAELREEVVLGALVEVRGGAEEVEVELREQLVAIR